MAKEEKRLSESDFRKILEQRNLALQRRFVELATRAGVLDRRVWLSPIPNPDAITGEIDPEAWNQALVDMVEAAYPAMLQAMVEIAFEFPEARHLLD